MQYKVIVARREKLGEEMNQASKDGFRFVATLNQPMFSELMVIMQKGPGRQKNAKG